MSSAFVFLDTFSVEITSIVQNISPETCQNIRH